MVFGFNRYWIDFKEDKNCERILKVLMYNKNTEVNAWKLSYNARVLHYTQAIMELRRKWYNIQNRIKWEGRTMHSFYKLKVD